MLEDRIALVTGATAGFGAAIAEQLVAAGAQVIATGRRAERLDALAARLGPALRPLAFDVCDAGATEAAVASVGTPIDILVNNAGLALGIDPAQRADLADWETMIATNCVALARLTRLVLPGMVAAGRGHVVQLGSIAGDHPYPGASVYAATKAFVRRFAENLRADLVGTGVRVTNVEPGLAETEFSLVRFKGDAAWAAAPYAGTEPLRADDIADAVLWAVTRPAHVNISRIEVWPTAQAAGGLLVHRG